jgi:O-antigen/teichoic acid export membrane protein
VTQAIAEWRARLRPSRFIGQVTVLASGASVAQAIGLLAAPVLTRLYTPTDFGVYALYVALLALASPLVSGRYELAVVPADSEDESLDLLILAAMLAAAAGGLVLLLMVFARSSSFGTAGLGSLLPFWWLIPLGVVLTGIQQARYLLIRHRRYPRISGTDVVQRVDPAPRSPSAPR